ncbi:MAG: GNAT family N-acetyltransferase [Fervidicoccaceae archaeon]
METVKLNDSEFYIELPNGKRALLKFEVIEELRIMRLLHTYTPPQFRGRGLGEMLVKAAIEDARRRGLKIEPVCSFSIYYFAKHPEDREILVDWMKGKSEEELESLYEYYYSLERR